VTLDDEIARVEAPDEELLSIDAALVRLQELDRAMNDVFKLLEKMSHR
jgi:hypothetical protein